MGAADLKRALDGSGEPQRVSKKGPESSKGLSAGLQIAQQSSRGLQRFRKSGLETSEWPS
eukprot:2778105-Alexandrium_andersonii.AAC.1